MNGLFEHDDDDDDSKNIYRAELDLPGIGRLTAAVELPWNCDEDEKKEFVQKMYNDLLELAKDKYEPNGSSRSKGNTVSGEPVAAE